MSERFPQSSPTPANKVVKVYGPRGPKGPTGDRGITGISGISGITGPAGPIRAHRWVGTNLQWQADDGSWQTTFTRT
jgi:hypothetical protein